MVDDNPHFITFEYWDFDKLVYGVKDSYSNFSFLFILKNIVFFVSPCFCHVLLYLSFIFYEIQCL